MRAATAGRMALLAILGVALCVIDAPARAAIVEEIAASVNGRIISRSQLLQRDSGGARAALDRCLPIYRGWGLAEREIVAGLVAATSGPR